MKIQDYFSDQVFVQDLVLLLCRPVNWCLPRKSNLLQSCEIKVAQFIFMCEF